MWHVIHMNEMSRMHTISLAVIATYQVYAIFYCSIIQLLRHAVVSLPLNYTSVRITYNANKKWKQMPSF